MGDANEHATDDHSFHRSRRQVLAAAGGLGAAVVTGCLGSGDDRTATGDSDGSEATSTSRGMEVDSRATTAGNSATEGQTPRPEETTTVPLVEGAEPTAASDTAWRSVEFSPVRRDETVTVNGFDRPVVLQAFAVWCPKCQRKQEGLRRLDDAIVKINVNIDPNEDAAKVRNHADEHGFDWRYVVAPDEMVRSLVGAFGTTVTNAPSTPVVVACPGGGSSFFAGRGNVAIPKIEATADNC